MRRKALKIGLTTTVLAVAFIGLLWTTMADGTAYYQHVDEVMVEPEAWHLDLPLGREFDYVVIADVIEHLRHRQQLLRGARRFLVEGGRLIISTPNIALWFYRLSLLVGRFEYGPRGILDETHVHFFTRATFRREVVKRSRFRRYEGLTRCYGQDPASGIPVASNASDLASRSRRAIHR